MSPLGTAGVRALKLTPPLTQQNFHTGPHGGLFPRHRHVLLAPALPRSPVLSLMDRTWRASISPDVSLCVVVGHVLFSILFFVDAPPGGDIMFRLFSSLFMQIGVL